MGKSGSGEEEVKKGPWTPEEDEKLVHYIQLHGAGKWRSLPKNAGLKRCGKSCRLRWTNYLRPDIKRGHFSVHEEHTIIHFHRFLGNKWSVIAAQLPGRTDNEIKNYWNTHIKKKLLRMGIDPVTHCPQISLLQLGSILNAHLFKSPLQSHNGSHMFNSTYMNPEILNLLPNLQIDSYQPNQPQTGSNQLTNAQQTDFMTGFLTSQITSPPVQWRNNVEYSGDYFPYADPNNRCHNSDVYATENPSACISNDDSENFATWNFGSVLSATEPSSSSTPVNSSSTVAYTNGGSEGERESYGGDMLMFDHHHHPNALNL